MRRNLFLVFVGLIGFMVASVGATLLQSIVGSMVNTTKPDPPGQMAPDPVRQATTKSQTKEQPKPKEPEPEASEPASEPAPAPVQETYEPQPAPPPAPTRGPGNLDIPLAPPPPYHSGPTGPGNM